MCYFINVGLPPSSQLKWIDLLPQKMHAWPSRYEGLSEKMNGFSVVSVGLGMCSCDLFNQGAIEESFKKYEKKGWSESKIARAIENRKKSNIHNNLHPDFRCWLADAVEETKKAYLFVHWDSKDINLEKTALMTVDEFRNQQTYIQDEQLICIKA